MENEELKPLQAQESKERENNTQEQKEDLKIDKNAILGRTLRENKDLKKEIEKLKNNLNVLLVSKEQEKKELDFFQDFKSLGGIEKNFQDFKNKHYEEIKELEKENFNDYILKAKEITPWAFANNEFETKNKVEEVKEIKKSNLVKGTLYKKTNI